MAEADAAEKTHDDMAARRYRNLFEAFSQAEGHAPAEQASQATFVRQVGHAKYVRDLAKAALA
jgi:hypothetical protein